MKQTLASHGKIHAKEKRDWFKKKFLTSDKKLGIMSP